MVLIVLYCLNERADVDKVACSVINQSISCIFRFLHSQKTFCLQAR